MSVSAVAGNVNPSALQCVLQAPGGLDRRQEPPLCVGDDSACSCLFIGRSRDWTRQIERSDACALIGARVARWLPSASLVRCFSTILARRHAGLEFERRLSGKSAVSGQAS
jgi:hypothetical protein